MREASTESGRIQLLQSFDGRTKSQLFEVECLALPVLSRPKKLVIFDSSKTTTWT